MTTLAQFVRSTWPDLAAAGNYPAIADAGNAPTAIPNPEPQTDVPKPLTLKRVMQIVPAAEMAKAYALPGYVADVRDAIDGGDTDYMTTLIAIAVAANALTQGSATALAAELALTEADPSWTATIAGPSLFEAQGFGPQTAASIQGALNASAQ